MCLSWFSPHYKAYLCLNRQTSQIYVSCYVVFNKFFFPLSYSLSSPSFPSHSSMFIPNFLISLSFPSSTTSHFCLTLFFLLLSFIHLPSHCLLPHFLLISHLSLLISQRTFIPLLQYIQFHLLYLLTFQSLFSITSHIPLTLIP